MMLEAEDLKGPATMPPLDPRLLQWCQRRSHVALSLVACCIAASLFLVQLQQPSSSYEPQSLRLSGRGAGQVTDLQLTSLLARVDELESTNDRMEKELRVLKLKSWQEHLDPQFQFRAKYLLGRTKDPEDKSGLEPFYLGHMVNTTQIKRRVYLDLGMREFKSSVCYILQAYPAQFTEIHAFECCPRLSREEESQYGSTDELPPLKESEVSQCLSAPHKFGSAQYTTQGVLGMTKLYKRYVGAEDQQGSSKTGGVPQVGLVSFLHSLDVRPEDYVVIKMDIEGSEYATLRALTADPWACSVVDEVMVEVHYADKEMEWAYWHQNFPQYTLSEARVLIQKLRDAGVVVHPWP